MTGVGTPALWFNRWVRAGHGAAGAAVRAEPAVAPPSLFDRRYTTVDAFAQAVAADEEANWPCEPVRTMLASSLPGRCMLLSSRSRGFRIVRGQRGCQLESSLLMMGLC